MANNDRKHDWLGIKTSWMMSKELTLGEFFKTVPSAPPANTWKKHTRDWHSERTRYREEVGKQKLENWKNAASKVVARHANMNQAAWTLAFNDLIQTVDPQTRKKLEKPRLKPGLTNTELLRLLALTQRHEMEMSSFGKLIAQMDVVKEDGAAQGVEEARKKLQAILKDGKALEGVEAILDVIQEEGRDEP